MGIFGNNTKKKEIREEPEEESEEEEDSEDEEDSTEPDTECVFQSNWDEEEKYWDCDLTDNNIYCDKEKCDKEKCPFWKK